MLDTLKFAKRLQEAGFTPMQAEAQAQALWEAIEGTVATKQDLRELEARIDGRFADVYGQFKPSVARTRCGSHADTERRVSWDRHFRRLYTMVGANIALNFAILIKLLTG